MNQLPKKVLELLTSQHLEQPHRVNKLAGHHVYECHGNTQTLLVKQLLVRPKHLPQALDNYLKAEQLEIGPKVLLADQDSGWLICQKIAGTPLAQQDLTTAKLLSQLTETLLKVHQQPTIDIDNNTPMLLQQMDREFSLLPSELQQQLHEKTNFIALQQHLKSCKNSCWTHQDFHPHNLILGHDGRLYVLDWDWAGPGLPEMDLAMMLQYLPESAKEIWLQQYLDKQQKPLRHSDILWWQQVLCFKCMVWAFLKALALEPNLFGLPLTTLIDQYQPPTVAALQYSFLNNTFNFESGKAWLELGLAHFANLQGNTWDQDSNK